MLRNTLLLPVLFILVTGCQPERPATYGLMVEFIREPDAVRVLDATPEFTWILDTAFGSQSAYQIQVASSNENLERGMADLWDSGMTYDNRSVEISYAGDPLPASGQYWWRVRCWDASDRPGAWSDIQSFRTGKLNGYGTTANVFESRLVDPVLTAGLQNGGVFYDFGRDAFGTLLLEIEAERTDTLLLHLGEKLAGESRIDRSPPGSVRYRQVSLTVNPGKTDYLLELPPDQRNTGPMAIALPDSFPVVMPFRYVEIEGQQEQTRINNLRQKIFYHYFEENASFFISSDTVLNQVWELCKYSIRATSFTGLYIDGDRERIPYEADALINQLSHYGTDREYAMARRTNEYFMDHPTWPTEWILQTILLFYHDFLYTGNLESVRHHYDGLKHKTLTSLAREDGLISTHGDKLTDALMMRLGFRDPTQRIRDIVDWPPSTEESDAEYASVFGERDHYDMVALNTVVNVFHFQALKYMAELAGRLHETEDSVFYAQQAQLVRTSINEKLLDHERGIYIDGEGSDHASLHANMLPLAAGIVPDAYLAPVISFIRSRGMACSVYGSQFLLEGLYEAGEGDYALDLLTATHDRSWWNMIRTGSTITMEAWDMKYKPNADWNHAWGAAPANIIPFYLWGIKPMEPGFSLAAIKPQLSDLTHSRIRVPTIRGSIQATYTAKGDSLKHYEINLPGNTRGVFYPVEREIRHMRVNGMEVDIARKGHELEAGSNVVEIIL